MGKLTVATAGRESNHKGMGMNPHFRLTSSGQKEVLVANAFIVSAQEAEAG